MEHLDIDSQIYEFDSIKVIENQLTNLLRSLGAVPFPRRKVEAARMGIVLVSSEGVGENLQRKAGLPELSTVD